MFGVPAAVIHYNFTHWIDEITAENNEKDDADKKEVVFSLAPATLVTLQAFSKATIKRVLKELVDEQLIFPVSEKECVYSAEPIIAPSSKVDNTGSKVDEGGSKMDNNSYCSIVIVPFEECSKTQPAVAPNNFVPYQEKDNDTNQSAEGAEFLSPFDTCYDVADDERHGLPAIRQSSEQAEFLVPLPTVV